jgi:hypothetical protein
VNNAIEAISPTEVVAPAAVEQFRDNSPPFCLKRRHAESPSTRFVEYAKTARKTGV